jgi:hypothetical protein
VVLMHSPLLVVRASFVIFLFFFFFLVGAVSSYVIVSPFITLHSHTSRRDNAVVRVWYVIS